MFYFYSDSFLFAEARAEELCDVEDGAQWNAAVKKEEDPEEGDDPEEGETPVTGEDPGEEEEESDSDDEEERVDEEEGQIRCVLASHHSDEEGELKEEGEEGGSIEGEGERGRSGEGRGERGMKSIESQVQVEVESPSSTSTNLSTQVEALSPRTPSTSPESVSVEEIPLPSALQQQQDPQHQIQQHQDPQHQAQQHQVQKQRHHRSRSPPSVEVLERTERRRRRSSPRDQSKQQQVRLRAFRIINLPTLKIFAPFFLRVSACL